MEYTKINGDEVAKSSLEQEAVQKEELAFSLEMNVEELEAHAKAGLGSPDVKGARQNAAVARREADAYAKASKLPADQINEVRLRFTHRWIEGTERNHAHHSAVLAVKASLGEPTANYDSILAGLDATHEIALSTLADLEGEDEQPKQKAPRKGNTRAAKG